ncbi:hypothetical protein PTKIN_Ptkin05aG0104700 [Pterospermum kingtungense]
MAQTYGQAKKDEESNLVHSKQSDLEQSKDLREKESEEPTSEPSFELNRKNLAILAASVVIIVLTIVFSILVFTTKNPKFQVRSVAVESLNYSTSPNASRSMSIVAKMAVKNPNFGYFRCGIANVTFAYRGKLVGQVLVPRARVRGLGTRKINAAIKLSSNNVRSDTNLGSDIRSEFLTLTALSKMEDLPNEKIRRPSTMAVWTEYIFSGQLASSQCETAVGNEAEKEQGMHGREMALEEQARAEGEGDMGEPLRHSSRARCASAWMSDYVVPSLG